MIVPPDRYYVRRSVGAVEDHTYWGLRRDPDGKLRNFLSAEEEKQYVADIADELDFIRSLDAQTILDVGCGPGWFLDQVDVPTKLGTEVCPVAIRACERRGLHIKPSCRSFADGSFDVVRCHHVIEHLEDPVAEMREMARVCRGWLILATPDFCSPAAVRYGEYFRMLYDSTHISLFTCESLHRLVRDHGFTVQRVDYPFPLRYATDRTMLRWRHKNQTSPPWPGSWLTLFATKD